MLFLFFALSLLVATLLAQRLISLIYFSSFYDDVANLTFIASWVAAQENETRRFGMIIIKQIKFLGSKKNNLCRYHPRNEYSLKRLSKYDTIS